MRHFDAAAVGRALAWPVLVGALRQAFRAGCEVPQRQVLALGGSATALLMPAWRPGGLLGVKTVTIVADNGARGLPGVHALYTVFSATTGVPLAVIEGSELTARRTAAASALAADFLAPPTVRRLVLVGAGRVAALVPGALRSVRPGLEDVAVWNRHPEAAARLARCLRDQGFRAVPCADLETAVRRADVVSCATLSTRALVQGDWLGPGAHLDLIGSFSPQMREVDGRCLARCRVFVDTEEALAKSGDVLQAVAEGHFRPSGLAGTLAALCRGEAAGRTRADELTLFKAVGTALEDLAAAELVLGAADNASPPH